ncbi:MAG: hypothetical protein SGJ17_06985 [Hyphomicrobiales bacterium]|nr:hypothetical protein [Hyphomicrobiales bacterium]
MTIRAVLISAMIFAAACPAWAKDPEAAKAEAPVLAANQYAAEPDAVKACAADPVVWVNLNKKSKAFHAKGGEFYGKTKKGAYMCEKEGVKAGFHLAGAGKKK